MDKNKVISFEPTDALKVHHRKERTGLHSAYLALDKDGETIAELRTYWPGEITCYACVWIRGDKWATGSDSAGGGGYCKESAAAAGAICAAGVQLARDIGGVGTGAIVDAMEAIGRHVAGKRFAKSIRVHA